MARRMLINALESEEVRIAVLDDGILQEYYVERESKETLVGNVYKGKVLNIHPGLQAAFVDIGIDKNAFLHASEIPGPITYDEQGREHRPSGEARQISNLAESGQEVLVQVIRDSVDAKGPSVSMDISLPGRYLVLTPRTPRVAVSKRIADPGEREGLKRLLLDLHPPEGLGFIIRTAGADRTGQDLQRDLEYLVRVWSAVARKAKTATVPSTIYQESDLVIRTIRDVFTPEVLEIVVDQAAVHNRVLDFFQTLMPRFVSRVKFHEETEPLFHRYNVESQIEQIYERRVNLKSGGTIVVEPTEALVSIDVNSGKFTRETSPEEMAYRTNMEAAAEIARQLRLRDLGGQIVVDFIDMRDPRHRRNVESVLRNAIRVDRAQATILRTSRLGLVEMARQKIHAGIRLLSYEPCEECHGGGYVKTVESVALGLLRQIRFTLPRREVTGLKVFCAQDVAHYIVNVKRLDLEEIEKKADKAVTVLGDREIAVDHHDVLCVLHGGTEVPLEEMNFKPLPPPPEPPAPVEPPVEAVEAEEPSEAGEEQGVLAERSPAPNEWQLPIEPPEGETAEALPASTRAIEPDFEEDASRYEERAPQGEPVAETRDQWRSRISGRPHRRPESSFHNRRQVRRPTEEPRQALPPVEEEPQGGLGEPQGGGAMPERSMGEAPRAEARPEGQPSEFRRDRGFGEPQRGAEPVRGFDRGRRDERDDRGGRGRGRGFGRGDWRRRDAEPQRGPGEPQRGPGEPQRGPEGGRGPRGRDDMRPPRDAARPGPQDDEWAVEEEFDAEAPPRGFAGPQRGPGEPQRGPGEPQRGFEGPPRRDAGREPGRGREDLAFNGGRDNRAPGGFEGPPRGFDQGRGPRGFEEGREGGEFPRRRRRRGGRGRRRGGDRMGGPPADRGPRPGGGYGSYDQVGESARREAPRDDDANGWEPERPQRGPGEPQRGLGEPQRGLGEPQRGFAGPPRGFEADDRGNVDDRAPRGRDEGRGGYGREDASGRGGRGPGEGRGPRGGWRDRGRGPERGREDRDPRDSAGRGMEGRQRGFDDSQRDMNAGRGGRDAAEFDRGGRGSDDRAPRGFENRPPRGGFRDRGPGGPPRGNEEAQSGVDEPQRGFEGPPRGFEGPPRGFEGPPRGFDGGRGSRDDRGFGRGRGRDDDRAPRGRDEIQPPSDDRAQRGPSEPIPGADEGRGGRDEGRGRDAFRRPGRAPFGRPRGGGFGRRDEAPAMRDEGQPPVDRGGEPGYNQGRDASRVPPPAREEEPREALVSRGADEPVRREDDFPRRDERPPQREPEPAMSAPAESATEAAPSPPAASDAAPAAEGEEEEEKGVGFHRKATRRKGRGRRGAKARGGLGAALEGEGGAGKE